MSADHEDTLEPSREPRSAVAEALLIAAARGVMVAESINCGLPVEQRKRAEREAQIAAAKAIRQAHSSVYLLRCAAAAQMTAVILLDALAEFAESCKPKESAPADAAPESSEPEEGGASDAPN